MIHQTQIILVTHSHVFPKHIKYTEAENIAITISVFVKILKYQISRTNFM